MFRISEQHGGEKERVRTRNQVFLFRGGNETAKVEKLYQPDGFDARSRLRDVAEYAGTTSAAACVCSVLNGSHAKAVHAGNHGSRCAVRAWVVLCGVRVARSQPREPRA